MINYCHQKLLGRENILSRAMYRLWWCLALASYSSLLYAHNPIYIYSELWNILNFYRETIYTLAQLNTQCMVVMYIYRNTSTRRLHEFEEHKMFSAIQNCRGTYESAIVVFPHFHLLSSFFVVVAMNENMISNCVCTTFTLLHSILLFDQRPPNVVVMVSVVHCLFCTQYTHFCCNNIWPNSIVFFTMYMYRQPSRPS